MKNESTLRIAGLATGAFLALLTFLFAFRTSIAAYIWPWPMGGLGYTFVGSIFGAIAGASLWVIYRKEWGAVFGGAINLFIAFLGFAVLLWGMRGQEGMAHTTWWAIGTGVYAVSMIGFAWWSYPIPLRDMRPMPAYIRWSFAAFAAILTWTGIRLVIQEPYIFPWPLKPADSALYGYIFLGAALYFAYGFFRPVMGNAMGQLWGFLAYDFILIEPYIKHLSTVKPEHRTSLVVYLFFIVYSMVMGLYCLYKEYMAERVRTVHG